MNDRHRITFGFSQSRRERRCRAPETEPLYLLRFGEAGCSAERLEAAILIVHAGRGFTDPAGHQPANLLRGGNEAALFGFTQDQPFPRDRLQRPKAGLERTFCRIHGRGGTQAFGDIPDGEDLTMHRQHLLLPRRDMRQIPGHADDGGNRHGVERKDHGHTPHRPVSAASGSNNIRASNQLRGTRKIASPPSSRT